LGLIIRGIFVRRGFRQITRGIAQKAGRKRQEKQRFTGLDIHLIFS
jgi:hypothetical protein